MYTYIELFKAKDAWLDLSDQQKAEYLQRVGSSMEGVLASGAELVGVGGTDHGTAHEAGYDFYAVWKLPSRDVVEAFERGIEDDGWYEYFDQVNASGELVEFETLAGRIAGLTPAA